MKVLGIETSCDETSVAVIDGEGTVIANHIASQIARHQPFGGVVPEIASREHLQHLMPLVDRALQSASIELRDVSRIAVTSGPGLIGALLVGVAAAQGIAYGLDIPLTPVNHLEGHIFSPYLNLQGPSTPLPLSFLTLVVSGGHSSIYWIRTSGDVHIATLNRTRDDAAGEVFDKVAKFIGLPYPGGPEIDRLAVEGDAERFRFPVVRIKESTVDFSFSGLKSNAIRLARSQKVTADGDGKLLSDFCASFQKAIGDQILDRLGAVWEQHPFDVRPTDLGLAGGVAANSSIRHRVAEWCEARGITARLAERRYCTDNGAMIAFAGLKKGVVSDPRSVHASSRMPV